MYVYIYIYICIYIYIYIYTHTYHTYINPTRQRMIARAVRPEPKAPPPPERPAGMTREFTKGGLVKGGKFTKGGLVKGGLAIRHVCQFPHQTQNLMYYNCTRETHKLLNPPLLNPPL